MNETPDIYLHLDGQQAGPYSPAQLRQLLFDGKVTAATPAWHQGLAEWSTLGAVLPGEGSVPPPFIPSSTPPPPPVKKGMSGCLLAVIIVGIVGFVGIFGISVLAGIALGPIKLGIEKAKENASMQEARAISFAMFSYATDHNGAYPDGKTSTEVFQKLLDGKYVTDPGLFYVAMPGKTRATSSTLTAENVCFDVTSGVTAQTSDQIPLVFLTGYTVTYTAGVAAMRDEGAATPFPGISVAYKNNAARFLKADPDGRVANFIPAGFDPGPHLYQQLKP